MNRLRAVANTFRARLACLAGRLWSCAHRRTGFPITMRSGDGADGKQNARVETYVVCLECGRHLAYDWTTMRITPQPTAGSAKQPESGGMLVQSVPPPPAIESILSIQEYARMTALEMPHERNL